MGILSKWKQFQDKRKVGQVAKFRKHIKNPKAIREDRQAALEFFRELDDIEASVEALLDRFEFSIENGITDTREKEAALEAIVGKGEASLPYVQKRLRETTRIAWPIKVLTKLGKESEVIDTLKQALNFEDVSFDQAQVDKNYDILCYLRDFQLPGYTEKLGHFLSDPDERVRFAAAEALIEQGETADQPKIAALLERFLVDHSSENTRIHQGVVRAFVSKKWPVSSQLEEEQLPPGIRKDASSAIIVRA